MIKRIVEPLSETVLTVHYGESGIKSFKKYLDNNNVEYGDLMGNAGFQIENQIFIHDIKDLYNLIHEGIHFLDYLNDRLNIHNEREFKAYAGAYIINGLIKMAMKG